MDRTTFLIDGFNLYHSLRDAERDLNGLSPKWLDVRSLCTSYLHLLGKAATLQEIYYFSALAKHLETSKPDVTRRHRTFIRCLKATGVITELSRFKKKQFRCPGCGERYNRYEEKETDVSIATKLLELFITDQCDNAVLVTGDTDLAPAFRTADSLFPQKRIVFAFPYKRKNKELAQLAPGSFEINKLQYLKHQFPDPFPLPSGAVISKPAHW